MNKNTEKELIQYTFDICGLKFSTDNLMDIVDNAIENADVLEIQPKYLDMLIIWHEIDTISNEARCIEILNRIGLNVEKTIKDD